MRSVVPCRNGVAVESELGRKHYWWLGAPGVRGANALAAEPTMINPS